MATIQVKRGLAAGLPTLASGEPGWTTDTNQFYIGTGAGNVLIGPSSGYTDEEAQDAVGTILVDSATIDFTYSDGTPSITASVIDGSISNAKFRDSGGNCVVGRAASTSGDVADISATDILGSGVLAFDCFSDLVYWLQTTSEGYFLKSGGNLGPNTWAALDATDIQSGTLPVDRGGTGIASYTLGDTLYGNALGELATLAGHTGANTRFLQQTGTGVASAAPAWGTILVSDLPNLNGFTDAEAGLTDRVPVYSAAASANRDVQSAHLLALSRLAPGGRLTLTSGTPVTTSDVTAAGTLYYTPYVHDLVCLWDGTRWVWYQFSETSLSLTLTSGNVYDIFGYVSGGVLTLESLVWTSTTARATAVTYQDGRYCKSGAKTRLYLGTIYATAANQTEDSVTKRMVWNMYNRVPRSMRRVETTASWNYTTATWRAANSSASNRLEYVCGLLEDAVHAWVRARVDNSSVAGANAIPGIKIDNTNGNDAQVWNGGGTSTQVGQGVAEYIGYPGLGYHYLQWTEYSEATGTTTWYSGHANNYTSGIQAIVMA